ncbi:class I SAM-dependent methyltransferase [Desulfamplus magnetovallimortis]|nr:class I SAM-dependent methyltransferase [Desulfamplus magnetovallimortis]
MKKNRDITDVNCKINRSVWDIGCGSGRDLLWLKQRGFHCTGLEYSFDLALMARKISGCDVVVGDFENFDFSRLSADGILLIAALVHLAPDKVCNVLRNVAQGIKKNGIVYISMKKGTGMFSDDTGRNFYLWQPEELDILFQKAGFKICSFSVSSSALGTDERWLGFLLHQHHENP